MAKSTSERILDYLKEELAKGNRSIDTKTISEFLGMQRSNVSTILNQLVTEKTVVKTKTRPVYYSLATSIESDSFKKLIGYEGSLSNVIKLAKAALHYPSNSLNTLILGEVGTGKSFLANLMYDYGKETGIFDIQSEFKRINCRHFINKPDELSETLFGKSTDEFTNLFEASIGSVLFLDNIHLLEGSSFARVIHFIETGVVQYLDGTVSSKMNITLIVSADIKSNPVIIQSLKLKIPVTLQLPELKSRPLLERFELINHFFNEEAITTQYNIKLEAEAMYGLLLVDVSTNIKSLIRYIKLAVANAYLRYYDSNINTIQIFTSDFEKELVDILITAKNKISEVKAIIPKQFNFTYLKEGTQKESEVRWNDFYGYLNKQIDLLQSQGYDKKKIDTVLNQELQSLIASFKKDIRQSEINYNQLSKVVDLEIIKLVTDFINESSQTLNVDYPSSVVYGLCLHLNAIYKNKRETKYLNLEKTEEIINNHPTEYRLAKTLAKEFELLIEKELSEDETVILTMFLILDDEKDNNQYPQLLIAMHGDSSAFSIANVINDLVKINNTFSYDMSLQKSGDEAYQELKELIQEIDTGMGVIVIYDMGSLKTILNKIASEISIPIRLVYIPLTLIGIDASRKAAMDSDIDRVYHNILSSAKKELGVSKHEQSAIICLCHTGIGGAIEIKNYLSQTYHDDIKIYALSMSDKKQLATEVLKIKNYYDVKAFVGTHDPKMFGIPFVPVSKIFDASQTELDAMLFSHQTPKNVDYEQIINYLGDELKLDKSKLSETIPKVIDELDVIFGLDLDRRVGLFLHMAALISKLINKDTIHPNQKSDWYLSVRKEEIKQIRNILSKLEKTFQIIVPDSELVTIFMIIEKEYENE